MESLNRALMIGSSLSNLDANKHMSTKTIVITSVTFCSDKISVAVKTKPELWARIVSEVKAEAVAGTRAGQWSARKAQLAVSRYKSRGGGYRGSRSRSNSLHRWTQQRWRTRSGKPSSQTGERYLPAKAIHALTRREYDRVTRSKRRAMSRGIQYSRMPKSISRKVSRYR